METVAVGGKGTIGFGLEGIILLVWHPGVVLEAEDVYVAMAMVNDIAGDSELPMLVDISGTKAVTREAKSVFAIPCAASRIALLGSSPVDRVIANYTIGRQQSLPCPTRFFTARSEATSWLLDPIP